MNAHVGLPSSDTCDHVKLEASVRRVRPGVNEGQKDRRTLTQLLFPPPDGAPQGRGGADVVEGADFKVVGGVGEDERDLLLRGAERVHGGLS